MHICKDVIAGKLICAWYLTLKTYTSLFVHIHDLILWLNSHAYSYHCFIALLANIYPLPLLHQNLSDKSWPHSSPRPELIGKSYMHNMYLIFLTTCTTNYLCAQTCSKKILKTQFHFFSIMIWFTWSFRVRLLRMQAHLMIMAKGWV